LLLRTSSIPLFPTTTISLLLRIPSTLSFSTNSLLSQATIYFTSSSSLLLRIPCTQEHHLLAAQDSIHPTALAPCCSRHHPAPPAPAPCCSGHHPPHAAIISSWLLMAPSTHTSASSLCFRKRSSTPAPFPCCLRQNLPTGTGYLLLRPPFTQPAPAPCCFTWSVPPTTAPCCFTWSFPPAPAPCCSGHHPPYCTCTSYGLLKTPSIIPAPATCSSGHHPHHQHQILAVSEAVISTSTSSLLLRILFNPKTPGPYCS
jgi:hypothetical protein